MDTKEQIDKLINDVVGEPADSDIAGAAADNQSETSVETTKPIDGKGVLRSLQATRQRAREAKDQAEAEAAKARQLEVENAYLKGRLEGGGGGAVEKSPLALSAEEQGCTEDEVVITGKLAREQAAWEQKRKEATAPAAPKEAQNAEVEMGIRDLHENLTAEQLGDGLGADVILTMGAKYLTPADKREIAAGGKRCGRLMYAKAIQRIQNQGTQAEKQHVKASLARREKGLATGQSASESVDEQEELLEGLAPKRGGVPMDARIERFRQGMARPAPDEE